MSVSLTVNRAYVGISLTILWLVFGGFVVFGLYQLWQTSAGTSSFRGLEPWMAGAFAGLGLLIGCMGTWNTYVYSHLQIDEESLVQPGVFADQVLHWDDVEAVFRLGPGLKLEGGGKRIVVTPQMFQEPVVPIVEDFLHRKGVLQRLGIS